MEDYTILPKRNGRSDGSFKKLNVMKYFTNYYEVALNSQKTKIYQYDIKLPEEVPQDSELYNRAVVSVKKLLRNQIKYLCHKGQMIWGTMDSKIPLTLNCRFEFKDNEYEHEAIITKRKEVTMKDLNVEETRPQLLQILNITLK